MNPLPLVALTFVVVLALIVGTYWLFISLQEGSQQRALEKRMRPPDPAKKSRLAVPKSEWREPGGPAIFRGLQSLIDQSGLRLTVPALLFFCWLCGFLAGLAVWTMRPHVVVAGAAGALCLSIPYLWVRYKASGRMWKFEEQFPEAIDLIARALRAGHAFTTGLSMVANEVGSPVGPEFKLLYDRQNFGMPLPEALRAFARRVPLLDARFFVTAVLTQREAGGNLSGVLDNLSAVIRERFKVKRQVKTLSAHGRMTAGVLMALPPIVAVAQFVIAPENAAILFNDRLGVQMLVGAAALQVLGMLIIRRIVRVEYEMVSPLLLVSLIGGFVAVGLASGSVAWVVLERQTPGRRRLRAAVAETRVAAVVATGTNPLTDHPHRAVERIASFVPKSPVTMKRLRRRLVRAGHHSLTAAVVYSVAEVATPVMVGLPLLLLVAWPTGIIWGLLAASVGYLVPGVVLERMIAKRRKAITNGLPDVLDLMIVCLEAGCSLDQAIVKATEELYLVYPALGEELKMLTTETRAGKPRLEAFKNLEARTKNEDVRALVAMLVQTDRFGTSISQALRAFADVTRTKRRQRAEERAAKVGVKIVFPLVLFLFPALYVVTLGAAIIQIVRVFFEQVVR